MLIVRHIICIYVLKKTFVNGVSHCKKTQRGDDCFVLKIYHLGVGKSKLAIEIAKELNGEIINADAMQMYEVIENESFLFFLF
jgi:hypothetical protein